MKTCFKIIVILFCLSSNFQLSASSANSQLYELISQYQADKGALERKYTLLNEEYFTRMDKLYNDWYAVLNKMNFEALSQTEKIDYVLFRNLLDKSINENKIKRNEYLEVRHVIEFSENLIHFIQDRRRAAPINSRQIAEEIHKAVGQIKDLQASLKKGEAFGSWIVASHAADLTANLRVNLKSAVDFYMNYHPEFTWWVDQPWQVLEKELKAYEAFLKDFYSNKDLKDDGSGIIGKPIGRKALELQLAREFIPYTPEELIEIANKEFAWCEEQMLKASAKLGFGNDWKAALEYVKDKHVPVGQQPFLVNELAEEAIKYVEDHDLLTLDEMAKETWRMDMMSPQQQLFAPFFLGGERVLIAYPTDDMPHDAKVMSLRGNNPHFTRAVVHHELIPGHHLQQFMNQRYKPYRRAFSTPFWTEGWALYWELNLWDKGFAKSTEDEVGMLFWRMHRCARIIFSLSYHLGQMTPQQSIDMLVDKVGHERANAEAEVRRSFMGNYGPLYQIAYMIGGMQFYALKKEVVASGKMTEKAFHDIILRNNSIPVELVRAILTEQKLTPDFKTNWRFKY